MTTNKKSKRRKRKRGEGTEQQQEEEGEDRETEVHQDKDIAVCLGYWYVHSQGTRKLTKQEILDRFPEDMQ
jgi:hypothetical protein